MVVLKLDRDDEEKELEFELRYQLSLTFEQRYQMMEEASQHLLAMRERNESCGTVMVIKRSLKKAAGRAKDREDLNVLRKVKKLKQ